MLVQLRLNIAPSRLGNYTACRRDYTRRLYNQTPEFLHTTLVGRFLPEPGVAAGDREAQTALCKALMVELLACAEDDKK